MWPKKRKYWSRLARPNQLYGEVRLLTYLNSPDKRRLDTPCCSLLSSTSALARSVWGISHVIVIF